MEPPLRRQASTALRNRAPSSLIVPPPSDLESSIPESTNPSHSSNVTKPSLVKDLASSSGRKQLKAQLDFDILRLVCAAGTPPTIVDREEFRAVIEHLNPRYTPVSSSTLVDALIPAEAALVLEKATALLKKESNLTLTLDGGSTRRSCSVYTFHVSTPSRRSFLMRGEDVSLESHTGEHIASLAKQIIQSIGPERFVAVVTDGAANVVLARRLLAEFCVKDICKIPEFQKVLNFFKKSTSAKALLDQLRKLEGILRGLESIGKTRFGTVGHAALSLLRCMGLIRRLVSKGAIDIPGCNRYFIPNTPASICFEMQLTAFTAVLSPILRAITCLESASATLADVLLFFSAALGAVSKHLASDSHGLENSETVSSIIKSCTIRFNQLINETPDDCYVCAFYLDPYYRDSQLLKNINPLSIKITLNRSDEFSSHAPTSAMLAGLDWDGAPNGLVRRLYSTANEAMEALRQQLLLYGSSNYPFSAKIGRETAAYTWWLDLKEHPMARLLAHFALMLLAITANSMADERTVSTFTWLNSGLRNGQDVATIVRQTQIRQFYGWKEANAKGPTRVRFRDLKQASGASSKQVDGLPAQEASAENDPDEYPENADTWLDEIEREEASPLGDIFELADLVNLDSPEIEDSLSDKVPESLRTTESARNERSGATQPPLSNSGDPEEVDWSFT
ncbi:hypothetical protein RhiXN_03694 [Rhizoctonia solani]|uniref:DUF659 domain-containing protein n=1 Tax=Rhizoctonia solani TaxID=456999 RepID=A0A8H8NND7_9AGAM|nr:uncharacterized protein RhiXN_03694 [Rhizoctonia solani]QRW15693.1 hypothetical protein RhiXN_03694 [Rhizoctonia solani]